MSRFSRYRSESDLPPLRKLEVGESFTAKYVGDHDYDGGDRPILVLELENEDGEFGWMASSWHAIEELDVADPQIGDTIKVRRVQNRGRSHQYEIDIVARAKAPEADPPIDTEGLPPAAKTIQQQAAEQFGNEPAY